MTSSPREIVLCQYLYSALDQLISHALPGIPERQRFYCKSRLATEIQGAMRYSIVQHGDHLLAQQRSEGDAPDTTLLATDQQRSVLQTLKANHPPQPIAYSSYGHRPVGSGLLSLLGFNGERPDPVTGHYLLGNGYRAFNPVLMRFNSPDSLSPFGKGGLNAYVYCAGDPVNLADPNGHTPMVRMMRSTLVFAENRAKQKIIKFTEHVSVSYERRSVEITTFPNGFTETTTLTNELGTRTELTFLKEGNKIISMPFDEPSTTYPATPTLIDRAYSALKPSDLHPDMRKHVAGLVPVFTDLRNEQNHASIIRFNLEKIQPPVADINTDVEAITHYDLALGNIKGSFPEKLGISISNIRKG